MLRGINLIDICEYNGEKPVLGLRFKDISTEEVKVIVKFLKNNPKIREFSFSFYSNINDDAVKLFADVDLEALYIFKSLITDEGIRVLATNPYIKKLVLNSSLITHVGAKALAENTSLRFLDISRSLIGDEGIKHFTELNTSLIQLKAYHCNISTIGAKAIASITTRGQKNQYGWIHAITAPITSDTHSLFDESYIKQSCFTTYCLNDVYALLGLEGEGALLNNDPNPLTRPNYGREETVKVASKVPTLFALTLFKVKQLEQVVDINSLPEDIVSLVKK